MHARAFTRDAQVFLSEHATAATLAHELVHVAQQRALGDRLPPEHTPAGRTLEAQANPAAIATPVSHIPVSRIPDGVQRDPVDPPPTPEPAPAQRQQPLDDALAPYHDQLIALCGQRPVDLDDALDLAELTTKLYPSLRGLLRSELIVDRERAGLLTDFR